MTDTTAPGTAAPGKAATGLRKGLATYGDAGFSLFLRRAFIKAMGYTDEALDRPIIGITDTFSDFNPCHGNVPDLIAAVKRGVMLAGGMPMAFPTISIHESFSHPTSMFLRNLMALDTEEMIRAQPMDAVVLIGGCDKTLPAQLMGAASADIPAIVVPTGPMLVGHHKGEVLGACTDCRRMWAKYRAGEIDEAEIDALTDRLAPTKGTCMVMGTASTVSTMVEAIGMCLPGGGSVPATHADRIRLAEASGAAAVRLARDGTKPSHILTETAFRNALVVLQAIGGSTNALIHFTAIAGRLGIKIDLEAFDRLGLDDPDLDVTADDVLVLRNAGPKGAPGMPEAGYIPIPRKLARAGVKDMVRISDARMSGTAFGTIVLHITPEAATGGPLGLVKTGDRIRLDAAARRIDLLVSDSELEIRRAAYVAPPAHPGSERGYLKLFLEQVTQADEGCDFAFCRAGG